MLSTTGGAGKKQRRPEHERLRELQRRAQGRVQLPPLEQARLEIETHESQLDVLLSLHKEPPAPFDWSVLSASLSPVSPQRHFHREQRVRQCAILAAAGLPSYVRFGEEGSIEAARARDEEEFQEAVERHRQAAAEVERRRDLARRVALRDEHAFAEALAEFNPVSDVPDLCVSARFSVHSASLVECTLRVNGAAIIPAELKSLTLTGKVATKAMPKARFHEILQDYMCGCVLRVAREVFDFLTAEVVLVTAVIDGDEAAGEGGERPVLSVAIPRNTLDSLDCKHLDPVEAIEKFVHYGDVRTSRATGEFVVVAPLTPGDLPSKVFFPGSAVIQARIRELRQELQSQNISLGPAMPRSIGLSRNC